MAPSRLQIDEIVRTCNCSDEQAIDLLNRYHNDIEKVKRRYPWFKEQRDTEPATVDPEASYLDSRWDNHNSRRTPVANKMSGSKTSKYPDLSSFNDDDATLNSTSALEKLPASPTISWRSANSGLANGRDDETVSGRCAKKFSSDSDSNTDSDGGDMKWDTLLRPSQVFNDYLDLYRRGTLPQQIDLKIDNIPSIFFAVETNDEAIVRLWVTRGGNVHAVHDPSGLPLLAFAIANSEVIDADTTSMAATLLSLGASPDVIPPEFYADCIKDLPESGPQSQTVGPETNVKLTWCTGPAREMLARNMNLTHRYQLWKAAKIQRFYQRQKQVALIKSAEPLLGLAHFLVGQSLASSLLLQKLLTHLVNPSKNRTKPLVLTFCGPSGHGKTELARRMGHLLTLELEEVNCTVFSREMELFGPRPGYVGSENGSPLNNFLARNSGKRCIVFLDEFEKTTADIHQALLLPFDNGECEDRRNRSKVDCSQVIFILATNALDQDIQNFCQQNADIFSEHGQQRQKLAKELSKILRQGFLQRFGAPLTGRISDFIPFLPFTPIEQAAVAHKFLLEMMAEVKRPVKLADGREQQLLGDTRLSIRRDGTFCSTMAANHYHPELGARSLKTAVEKVLGQVTATYLKTDEEIREGVGIRDYVMDMDGDEVVVERVVAQ